jgi:hypothetical protein
VGLRGDFDEVGVLPPMNELLLPIRQENGWASEEVLS